MGSGMLAGPIFCSTATYAPCSYRFLSCFVGQKSHTYILNRELRTPDTTTTKHEVLPCPPEFAAPWLYLHRCRGPQHSGMPQHIPHLKTHFTSPLRHLRPPIHASVSVSALASAHVPCNWHVRGSIRKLTRRPHATPYPGTRRSRDDEISSTPHVARSAAGSM